MSVIINTNTAATLAATNLGDRKPGDRVNLEADVLGKYVVHYLERTRHGAGR